MKKTAYIVSGALVLVMGMSGAAMAHGKGKGMRGAMMEQMFETVDADQNGSVTLEELEAAAAARFAKVDTDGDGFLSAEEMVASRDKGDDERRAKGAERMIDRMDENDDGKLSLEEATARRDPAKMFEKLDADGDGALTKEEMADARGKHGKKHRKGGDKDKSSN